MRAIVCEECGRRYDFDRDDFCPRCGAFNPPAKKWGVDAQGNVVRVDGVNESNHAGSFVHREVHREKTVRRIVGLDRDTKRRGAAMSRRPIPPVMGGMPQRKRDSGGKSSIHQLGAIIVWLLILFFVFLPMLLGF